MTETATQTGSRSLLRRLLMWLLAALLPIFAIIPTITTPVEDYAIDTAAFHIYRTVVFSEARAESDLFSGGILPRWTQPTNGGLGGPLFAYTPTLMYFLMDGFHTLGLDYVYTWRAVIVLMLVIASVGMFGFARELFRRNDAAYLSAAAFVYAPLLLRDFIERGSPQATGVALFPWVLWLAYRLACRPNGVNFALTALAWALLVFAHNLSAVLLTPVIGILCIMMLHPSMTRIPPSLGVLGRTQRRMHRLQRIGFVLLALVVGSLLVAFYVFPVFAELQYIQIDNPQQTTHAYPPDNPTPLDALFALPPVFDTGLGNNTMGAGVGLFHIFIGTLVLIMFVFMVPLFWSDSRSIRANPIARRFRALSSFLLGTSALGLLVLWLQTDSATPVWRALDVLDVLQFRFRLLSVLNLAVALNFGWFVTFNTHLSRTEEPDQLKRTWQDTTNIAIAVLVVTIGISLFALYPDLMHRYNTLPENLTSEQVKENTIAANTASLSAFNEYVPIWRHMPFTAEEMQHAAASPVANLPEGATITQDERKTGQWNIEIDTPDAFTAAFYLLYYPGWEARIDGDKQSIRPADEDEILPNTGYLLLDVPAGSHEITLEYGGTTAQHIGDGTSLLMALLLIGLAIRWRPGWTTLPEQMEILTYPAVRVSLVAILLVLLLVGNKTVWLDDTYELLPDSTCDSIHDVAQFAAVDFGPYRLCGYKIQDATLGQGGTLRLTLYWQIDEAIERPATSFAHVIGEKFNPQTNTIVWGESDHRTPGDHPT
ncbi:MAG: glycosyltransferase family 39 protein, partial [Anaerolineae bacterium]|nr:glycosyltransferase family 39 protein [Anaerolineae bacterium]